MIALYNLLPLYCPSCGTPTRLERADNPMSVKIKVHLAISCAICGVMCQLVDITELIRATTLSGGDLVEFFIDRDELPR
jgi:hypothetical protein